MSKNLLTFASVFCFLSLAVYFLPQTESSQELLDPGQQMDRLAIAYLIARDGDDFEFDSFQKNMNTLGKAMSSDEQVQLFLALVAFLEGEAYEVPAEKAIDDPRWDLIGFLQDKREAVPDATGILTSQTWLDMILLREFFEKTDQKEQALDVALDLKFYEQDLRATATKASYLELISLIGLALVIQTFFQWATFKKLNWDLFKLRPIERPLKPLIQFLVVFFFVFTVIQQVLSMLSAGIWMSLLSYLFGIALAWVLLEKLLFSRREILRLGGLSEVKMTFTTLVTAVLGFCVLVFMYRMVLFGLSLVKWPFNGDMSGYEELMNNPVSASVMILLSCLIAPIWEEFLFRGLIFKTMAHSMTRLEALLWSSLVFALFHPTNYLPLVFTMGFCLGLIYMRSRNLLAPVVAHVLWNLTNLLMT
ncbi:MAG: hypothetical protein CSA81_12195 [Acidobacteria bacterium]|nr:MAG: hypothetical protein CSA81_12195 [Acidobacteriota bacterium]